jgi:uncharacterized membrane protein YgaE (UPF0421/DUF939 family)
MRVTHAPQPSGRVRRMLRFAGFPLSAWAFALRTWAAMMLALYVAFWLQLENGYIAAFTVGILSLQTRGQAYQKALYQLLMTVVGVVASIVIAGLLAQTRDLFVMAYAIWLGLCVPSAYQVPNTKYQTPPRRALAVDSVAA